MNRLLGLLSAELLVTIPAFAMPQADPGIVPAAFRSVAGNSNNNIPFSWTPVRYQQVFLGSELPAARKVVGLGLRFDEAFASFTAPGYEIDLDITLGYTTKTPTSMQTTFASNFDVASPAPVRVFPRSKFLLPDQDRNRKPSPSEFELQIPFRIPFNWVRSPARNLLIEVRVYGNAKQNFRFSYPIDACQGVGATTSRLFGNGVTAQTGLLVKNQGLVMAFLDKVAERGSYLPFGSGCPGTGGHAGVIVPKIANAAFGGSARGIGGRTQLSQQVVDRSEMGPKQTFTGVEFRTTVSEFDIDPRNVMLEIRVGHTKTSSTAMSASFAANRTSALTTVLPNTSVRYPMIDRRNDDLNYFAVRIPWARPFVWDDSRKENLVFEMRRTDTQKLSYPVDFTVRMLGTATVVATSLSASTGTLLSAGYVMRLTTNTPVPQQMQVRNLGRPILGKSYDLEIYDALAKAPAVLFLGLSKQRWGSVPLPFALTPIGGGSCRLLVSPDFAAAGVTNAVGSATLRIPVPSSKSLAGFEWFHQWAILDRGANALGLAWSPGGTAHVGVH